MKVTDKTAFSFGGVTELNFDEAVEKVREVLKEQGFGVLTEIDAKNVLKEKLGLDRNPYKILGACNPSFAHQALDIEPEIGTLLPCNVVIYEDQKGKVIITAMNPEAALKLVNKPELNKMAKEVRTRIENALMKL